MLEVELTGQRGRTGSSRNGNEAVADVASEALARWLHHQQGPVLQHLHGIPSSNYHPRGA